MDENMTEAEAEENVEPIPEEEEEAQYDAQEEPIEA